MHSSSRIPLKVAVALLEAFYGIYGVKKKDGKEKNTIPRSLELSELKELLKIINSIKLTIEKIKSIEALFIEVEKNLFEFPEMIVGLDNFL